MSFYGLNRAAINAGVASFVAGAALLAASSTVEASGTRVVLLADIFVTSGLKATYTIAWAHQTSVLEADGFITRPGAGNAPGHFEAFAVPLVDVGFASNLVGISSGSADASVQRNGQTTVERDGYAKQVIQSSFTVEGLRTALGYVNTLVSSECSAVPIKIHGGSVEFVNLFAVSVIASTDMAISKAVSDFTAHSLLTQSGQAKAEFISSLVSDPTAIKPAQAYEMAGLCEGWAIPRLGILAQANSVALSFSEAYGHSIQPGFAESSAGLLASAQWALLIESDATIQVQSSMSALPYTNAEAADPPNRTMRRIGVDRVMRRPFVDRVMRRQA